MKLTNHTMITAIITINKCADYVTGKTAYAMLKTRQILQRELEAYEECRKGLLKKYGTCDENGEYSIDQEDKEKSKAFVTELTEILNMEVDVDAYQIKPEDFGLEFVGDITLHDYDMIEALLVNKSV